MNLEQRRLSLKKILDSIPGCKKTYYTPPTGMEMEYPCIIYDIIGDKCAFADNIPYLAKMLWSVIVIDEDPDSILADHLLNDVNYIFDRKFSDSGLNHFVFSTKY